MEFIYDSLAGFLVIKKHGIVRVEPMRKVPKSGIEEYALKNGEEVIGVLPAHNGWREVFAEFDDDYISLGFDLSEPEDEEIDWEDIYMEMG